MGLSEQINKIIEKRQARVPDIRKKAAALQDMERFVREMEALRREMIAEDGEAVAGGRFEPLLQKNPEMIWGLRELSFQDVYDAIENARKALAEYERRCIRDTVNISVVGIAGSGKSALLQSISGLGSRVIPSFKGEDCTGAPSVIVNTPGKPMNVHLTFKSRDAMRDMAQQYLDLMLKDESVRPHLHSMEEIRSLDVERLQSYIPVGASESIYASFLAKLVDHYAEWVQYVDSAGLDLQDENQIITFVSQHNGKPSGSPDREDYYKYLAVDTCTISRSFLGESSEEDQLGRICLIDTVGLGDLTVGIVESMLKTVSERSDAVIIAHKPENARYDKALPETLRKGYATISKICGSRALDKWLYYFLNHDLSKDPESMAGCRKSEEELKKSAFYGHDHVRILSAIDREAVIDDFLIPMLEEVADNLDEIDETYRAPVRESFDRLYTVYMDLYGNARNVLQSNMRSDANLAPQISRLSRDAFGDLRAELYSLMKKWRTKREEPSPVLNESAAQILKRMTEEYRKDFYLPQEVEIVKRLNRGELAQAVYSELANNVRNDISKDFLNVDVVLADEITAMKNELAVTLMENCGLGVLCQISAGEQPYVWLDQFCNTILEDERQYPNLRLAFQTISSFRFSVKGFLTYEVRRCLDDLDLAWINIPPLIVGGQTDPEIVADNIKTELLDVLRNISKTIRNAMKELCIKPNRAVYAEIMDFYDRVIYADTVQDEWNDLYANYSVELWGDELQKQAKTVVLCKEWLNAVDQLKPFSTPDCFTLQ